MIEFFRARGKRFTEATWKNWKNRYPELLAAIARGREEADARVAERMYQRALG